MEDYLEVYQGFGETLSRLFTGGDSANEHFEDRQELKARTYRYMLDFWKDLTLFIDKDPKISEEEDKEALKKIFNNFSDQILGVYEDFKPGIDYTKMGLWERVGNNLGLGIHRLAVGTDPTYRDIQYELEKLWKRLFRLKKKVQSGAALQENISDKSVRIIAEQTANYLRKNLYESIERDEKVKREAGEYQPPSSLELEFRDKLLTNLGQDFSPEVRNQIARKIANSVGPEISELIAQSLEYHMDGRELVTVSPALNSLISSLNLLNYNQLLVARIICRSNLIAIKVFEPEVDPKVIEEAFLNQEEKTKKDIKEAFRTLRQDYGLQGGIVIRSLTGVPEWADREEDLDYAADRYYHSVLSVIYPEIRLRQEMEGGGGSVAETGFAAQVGELLSPIMSYRIAAHIEPFVIMAVNSRLRTHFEVSSVFGFGEIGITSRDYLAKRLKDVIMDGFTAFLQSDLPGTYQSIAEKQNHTGAILLGKSLGLVSDIVDEYWGATSPKLYGKNEQYVESVKREKRFKELDKIWEDFISGIKKEKETLGDRIHEIVEKDFSISRVVDLIPNTLVVKVPQRGRKKDLLRYYDANLQKVNNQPIKGIDNFANKKLDELSGVAEDAARKVFQIGREMLVSKIQSRYNKAMDHLIHCVLHYPKTGMVVRRDDEVGELKHFATFTVHYISNEIYIDEQQNLEYDLTFEFFRRLLLHWNINLEEEKTKGKTSAAKRKTTTKSKSNTKVVTYKMVQDAWYDFISAASVFHSYRSFVRASGERNKDYQVLRQLSTDVVRNIGGELVHLLDNASRQELKKIFPDLYLDAKFDLRVEYDLNTPEGIMKDCFRNIEDLISQIQFRS